MLFSFSSHLVYNELASRQLILQQMLIDTSQIDHLRVNFVAHFNTENNVRTAVNEITTLIENYPREMTTQLRQWLTNQSTNGSTKKTQDFEGYLKELEENLLHCQQNQSNPMKFKVNICLQREREKESWFRNFSN